MTNSIHVGPKSALFTRTASALGKASTMPPSNSEAHNRLLTETGTTEADIQRYFHARELAAELTKLARGDALKVYKAYQAQCGDKAEAALATQMLAALGALAEASDCLPQIAFALLSGGGTVTAIQLVTRPRAELSAALELAAQSGKIEPWPKTGANMLKRVVERLVVLRDGLNLSMTEGASPLGQTILLADPRLGKVSALFDHALATGGFFGMEKIRLNRDEKARLDAVQKLAKATDNNMPLVSAFMAQHAGSKGKAGLGPGRGRTIKPDALIAAAVAAPAELWEKLASPATANARKAGGTAADPAAAEAAKTAAAEIAAKLRLAEPRLAMMAQFAKIPDGRFKSLATVLERHKGFDPAKQSASRYFKGNKAIAPAEMETLKSFQRLIKIAPEGDNQIAVAAAVHAAGFHSAGQILQAGKIDFTKVVMDRPGFTSEMAAAIYCRVKEVSDLRAELQIRLSHSGVRTEAQWQDFMLSVDAHAIDLSAPIKPLSLAEMFGSFDSCACTECQSVHSPASYLHNLLHWMKSEVPGAWGTLNARRPDIKDLLLSCANTHTMLPYIDIVNELLCARIVDDPTVKPPFETTLKEPALRLQPEYRNRLAEKNLAEDMMFPLSLPFERSSAEGKAALAVAGMPLHEAMELFLPHDRATWVNLTPDPTDAHLAASLGLGMPELHFILTQPLPATGALFWLTYTGVTAAPSDQVGHAMTALGVEFEELKELLTLDFVRKDENGKLLFAYDSIEFADEHCSYDTATFEPRDGDSPPLNAVSEAVCLNALRLKRLARATGYAEALLDSWLKRFFATTDNPTTINREFLHFLAQARRIEKLTKVSVAETLAFLSELAATDPETEANIELFVNLYGMRKSADVERCFALFGAQLQPGISSIDALTARIETLDVLYASIVDTAKIPAWIEPLAFTPMGEVFSKPVFIAIRVALFLDMDAMSVTTGLSGTAIEGPLDRTILENTIFKAISRTMGISESLARDIYISRNDTWFDDCHVATKANYPTAITLADPSILGAYMSDLWHAAMPIWLDQAINVCGCSPALADAIKAIVEPASGPEYQLLTPDFVLRLAKLRQIAKSYRLREDFLVGALFSGTLSDGSPFLGLDGSLIPSIDAVWNLVPASLDELETLEKAAKLHRLSADFGVDPALLATIFASPSLPVWSDNSLGQQDDDNSAKLTKMIAADRKPKDRISIALQSAMDDIRKNFRDALVAYTMRKEFIFEDMDDIYKHLLLDPAMQPCMMTSRLVLATNSVQLLMHRALLNLEGSIHPTADNKEEFEWRKNYRVWEANVKVLLYPENWIEPDLRLDQTPLFESAVAALSQDELNDETCEAVLYDYLSGLDKIARLDIRAFWRDESTTPDTLHVFGRSWNAPYEYFHRRRTHESVWTPWEKIDIDIEGDHLIPVMFHDRLWLFWPIFVEKEHRDIKIDVNGEKRGAPYLEIRMAYTTFEHGRWRGKKLLGPVLEAGSYSGPGVALNVRRKLGADKKLFDKIPTISPLWKWDGNWRFNIGTENIPDEPTPFFKYYNTTKYLESYVNLSLIYDDGKGLSYSDYAKADLERSSFFFWAKEDRSNRDLSINIRRAYSPEWENFHTGYTEMAYEDGFLIDACGTGGRLIPATAPSNEPRIVARPYRTLPESQNMIEGFDRLDAPKPNPLHPLYAKIEFTHGPGSIPILAKAPPAYTLTYPQKKDAMWTEPFFMADRQHTHFFERGMVCKLTQVQSGTGTAPAHALAQDDRYTVTLHEHPYSCLMIANFNRFGIKGLYPVKDAGDGLLRQSRAAPLYFKQDYDPGNLGRIKSPLPKLNFDFSREGAYSAYNWELFFHLPTLIARQLKTEGRHREAIRWLQLIFDPTSRESLGDRRVWRFNPFMTASTETSIAAMVNLLSQGGSDPLQDALRASVEAQIRAWQNHPFEPYRIAESRHSAFMLWCVLEYVDVLIEWGDALFRQDSMESINEATNLYVLANEILGKRPTTVDKGSSFKPKSFAQLLPLNGADTADNIADDLEAELAGYAVAQDCRANDDPCRPSIAGSLFPGQYFCVPANPKLPEFWDRVEDRLFKIRHCRNLAGEQRSLALFQPPIDPALLVRARAAGLSIESIMSQLAEAQLPYRFQYLLGKAQDFTAEVKALGGQLLSAIEKKDAEELSQIRQTHELNIQRATRNLKLMSLAEAKEGLAALQHSLKGAEISHQFLTSREFMNSKEQKSHTLTYVSDGFMVAEQVAMAISGLMTVIPDVNVGTVSFVQAIGGTKLGSAVKALGTVAGIGGSISRSESSRASTMGSYERREEDWRNQADQAAERLKELNRQIISAEIRIQTAEKDLEVFDQQVENSKEIYDYMRSKFSNEQLYGWMVGQLKTFHRQAYELAANMARQAQLGYKHELSDGTTSLPDVVSVNHWDSGRAGLLAGEKLSFELKKLDDAYLRERARRPLFELSRTVSLRRLDPVQLFNLKGGGPIEVSLPKWLFQTNHNGRTLKNMKLKGVSISLPCTVGPNTRVPLHVRLTSDPTGSPSQRSIITSTAMSDSGRFDPNPNGETYLPFENEKVESTWEITLPENLEFDPATISDLIFNIRYTAEPTGGVGNKPVSLHNLSVKKGHFAISLRQDNYDGWLKLQREIPLSATANLDDDSYFDAVVTKATPYVYGSATTTPLAYYLAILSTGKAIMINAVGDRLNADEDEIISLIPLIPLMIDEDGKIKSGTDEIVDIIQIRSVP